MKRRDFLSQSGKLATLFAFGPALNPALLSQLSVEAALPLLTLQKDLESSGSLLVLPDSAQYQSYLVSFNKRTQLSPQLRVIAKSAEAVSQAILWAQKNRVPFATRSGGHSYEGFSQSTHMVIDVRGMQDITMNGNTVEVGSGAALGQVYEHLSVDNKALPAGSCPTVGVAGHTLGGGFGLLARPYGLAADNLLSIELVDAQGRILTLSPNENAELFWACRGGGSGSFGVATRFEFKTQEVPTVTDFGVTWQMTPENAVKVMRAWQDWIQTSSTQTTCIFRVSRHSSTEILLHCAGQSLLSQSELDRELADLEKAAGATTRNSSETKKFIDSVHYFAGGEAYESIFMKAKSDYVTEPMSEEGMMALMKGLLANPAAIDVICDSYGGAINKVPTQSTAFAHRGTTLFSMQYYMSWSRAADSDRHVQYMRELYQVMRPYVSGGAYVNYCDLDLPNYAQAYWGSNLPQLEILKKKYDSSNFFRHAQSVPLKS